MPYGDANAIVMEMAAEVLTVVKETPVLAGVCGTDPFRQIPLFLKQVKEIGFAGVQNFPTVGLYDGLFRKNLEETGMGYGLEVEMIRVAHAMDLLTTPYCFNPAEATAMAMAGADIIVAHLGLTTKGSIGASTAVTLEEAPPKVQEIADAAKSARKDVIRLVSRRPDLRTAGCRIRSSSAPKACTASMAPRAWNAYRSKRRSPKRCRATKQLS